MTIHAHTNSSGLAIVELPDGVGPAIPRAGHLRDCRQAAVELARQLDVLRRQYTWSEADKRSLDHFVGIAQTGAAFLDDLTEAQR